MWVLQLHIEGRRPVAIQAFSSLEEAIPLYEKILRIVRAVKADGNVYFTRHTFKGALDRMRSDKPEEWETLWN